jgi:predicted RNase H-like HicB family nuclease
MTATSFDASPTKTPFLQKNSVGDSTGRGASVVDEDWTATAIIYDHLKKEVADLKDRVAKIERAQSSEIVYSSIIRDLSSSEISLKRPMNIILEKYDGEYIAKVPELEVFGSASTESEAIMNLKQEIVDLYEDLEQAKDKDLGLLPLTWKRVLTGLIKKNP